ncbi:uncharacterized protein LACBIDRAFT_333588 [Laccaria bicolor S238N-H82]|uniref:Predicted protein n=1 Tax=Laccaria bicolor (strain S238N-H82 / ATCC MYA-4686) TaxID=486041 RepID=B0DWF2_LACBS|nr:uncharacterized protein LACBIDRAFT_333588 [Laccaria bicolor S238N-H82]EDR01077.1 predicted protein [Laccaria bicolor S238N-H82]|eukprot:XP_001888296.1 predicted protein [Laccaria bicolor S238N-H82]
MDHGSIYRIHAGPPNPIPNVSRFQESQPISDGDFNSYHPTDIAADVNLTIGQAGYPPSPFLPYYPGQAEPLQNRMYGATYHMPQDGKYLGLACLYLISCVVVVSWMMISGPMAVPRQDTRITNIIISIASKGALGLGLWIVTLRLRVQWTHILVSEERVQLRSLLAACGKEGSFSRIRHIHTSPTRGIALTAAIGAVVTILMTSTSAGFKYIVLPGTAIQEYSGPDFVSICNYSLLNSTTGYFCTGTANAVTVNTEWNYIDLVSSGDGGNVVRSNRTSSTMSANVTLTSAPANLRLPTNPTPPWAAIDVSCRNVVLSLSVVGNGSSTTNVLLVDNRQSDTLTVAEMPSWSSQVQLYHQVNETGPVSSLSPWYMVMLARDLDDGGANMQGLSGSAVTYLGNSFLDLHGYSAPVLQGILGAAAYCNFSGSTGGTWPSVTWPAPTTTNVILGKGPYDGDIDISTAFLNYGPSWQYNPVSGNSLPGGSVSYIANVTTEVDNFADYIAMYMRNQWALMMYTNNFIRGFVTNTPYRIKTQPQLYIQATTILIAPASALGVCVLCAFICMFTMSRLGLWYGLVDIAPWWLMKATGVACGRGLGHETKKSEFETWSNDVKCVYYKGSDAGTRQLTLL